MVRCLPCDSYPRLHTPSSPDSTVSGVSPSETRSTSYNFLLILCILDDESLSTAT